MEKIFRSIYLGASSHIEQLSYLDVADISYYDGLWHTNEDVHVILDATNGKAVFSTYCKNDPEYLTDLQFSDNVRLEFYLIMWNFSQISYFTFLLWREIFNENNIPDKVGYGIFLG